MFNYNHYPKYADSTYRRMTKDELIEEIHHLLHNWESCAIEKEKVFCCAIEKTKDFYYAEEIVKRINKDNLTKILTQYFLNTKNASEINDLVDYIIKEIYKEK